MLSPVRLTVLLARDGPRVEALAVAALYALLALPIALAIARRVRRIRAQYTP